MAAFLERPGSSGPVGANMDEYARAAEELCRVVERFDQDSFEDVRQNEAAGSISVRGICRHVCSAARGYANDLRQAQGVDVHSPDTPVAERVRSPVDVRVVLAEELRLTEASVDPLRVLSEKEVMAMEFRVSWGALYNPESMLEHAICHLLRHRRQLEHW